MTPQADDLPMPPDGVVANREDAALHAFALAINLLLKVRRTERGRAAEILLQAAEALGGPAGRAAARTIAGIDYRSGDPAPRPRCICRPNNSFDLPRERRTCPIACDGGNAPDRSESRPSPDAAFPPPTKP